MPFDFENWLNNPATILKFLYFDLAMNLKVKKNLYRFKDMFDGEVTSLSRFCSKPEIFSNVGENTSGLKMMR